MFVKANVRKSLLAKMLGELLDTRVMVKGGMKGQTDKVCRRNFSPFEQALIHSCQPIKALLKLLNARQLALKFLANVCLLVNRLLYLLTRSALGDLRIHFCYVFWSHAMCRDCGRDRPNGT